LLLCISTGRMTLADSINRLKPPNESHRKVDKRSNDKRATGVERRCGWLGGKSSEGQNPMGGSGVKQSHTVPVGGNRREGEKP
jgi:hypothetical protein